MHVSFLLAKPIGNISMTSLFDPPSYAIEVISTMLFFSCRHMTVFTYHYLFPLHFLFRAFEAILFFEEKRDGAHGTQNAI